MFDHTTLSMIWCVITGLLLLAYLVLDGFDLGVGILHPVARTEEDRQIMMNAIGPFWNGNEVWLVTFAGVLFGAFPVAYAALLSGFYIMFMLILFCLIFRAVSLEFRSQVSNKLWRFFWDGCFWFSSVLVTMVFGIIIGNSILGVPLSENQTFMQGIGDQLNLYSILIGACLTSLFALHGSMFLFLKTEGELKKHIHTWTKRAFALFLVLFLITLFVTSDVAPRISEQVSTRPLVWFLISLCGVAIASMFVSLLRAHPTCAFLSSSCTVGAISLLFCAVMFPTLIYSTIDPALDLTIYNACSGEKSLNIMFIFALIGFPLIMTYTFVIYRVFWKSKPNSNGEY
jgi:cytochrome bd ubiquinol oxidase subunit II